MGHAQGVGLGKTNAAHHLTVIDGNDVDGSGVVIKPIGDHAVGPGRHIAFFFDEDLVADLVEGLLFLVEFRRI